MIGLKIYQISKKLKKYPTDKSTWLLEKERLLNEKTQRIENDKKRSIEDKKLDIEIGHIILEYDIYPDIIKTNIPSEGIKTDQKGNLNPNEKIESYNYLRYS